MLMAMLGSSDRPLLGAHLVGAGNESGTPPPGMKGGSETSGDITQTSARLVDEPSSGPNFVQF
jgi:hypothetical protein